MSDSEREIRIKLVENFLFKCSLDPTVTLHTMAKVIATNKINEVENILYVCSLDPTITLNTKAKMIVEKIYNKDDKELHSGNHNTKIVL